MFVHIFHSFSIELDESLNERAMILGSSDSDDTTGFTGDSNLQFHGSIDKVIDFDLLGRSWTRPSAMDL